MTDSTYKPLRRYLAQLHAYAQTVEVSIRKMIEDTEQTDREALAAEADFAVFVESWAAMLLTTQDLADEAGIDLAVFGSGFADLLITIHALAASNQELREMMQASISNKIGNAELIGQNIEWMQEVTPDWLANYLTMIRRQDIMTDAIDILKNRGEAGMERRRWLREALGEGE